MSRKKDWVTWCKYWGQGETGVLDYLARYVHRIAITNSRIIGMDDENVTFRYPEARLPGPATQAATHT